MTVLKLALSPSSGREAPNLVDPLDQAVEVAGHHRIVNLLRYAPEDRSSPRVVTGKLNINYKTQI